MPKKTTHRILAQRIAAVERDLEAQTQKFVREGDVGIYVCFYCFIYALISLFVYGILTKAH